MFNGHRKVGEVWMTDLERVLQGLDCISGFGDCLKSEAFAGGICAYCMKEIAKKAKELLKEQEPVEPEIQTGSGVSWWYICGNCKTALNPKDKFCHECGRRIKWE